MATILIIDDDPTVQMLLSRALAKSGYEIQIAKNGLEGLNLANHLKPALVICDWLMPELSGLEVCQEIKKNADLATTFFILITSRVSIQDRIQGLDAGADDFICKPIDLQELKARVRAGLRLHQLSEDLHKQKLLLETELNEAAEYVSNLLPEPFEDEKLKVDFRFIPSRQLGGDIFDYFYLDQENFVFYLLDVSGHGLKAALPSISIVNLLRSRSLGNTNYAQPRDVLAHLNDYFQMTIKNDKYFTIWYGVYNTITQKLTFSSAGHPPCIAIHLSNNNQPNTYQRLKTKGIPIGMFPNLTYQQSSIYISNTTDLYLFSDGVYEIHNQAEELLGLNNFIGILQQSHHNLPEILTTLNIYSSNSYFHDDLSILKLSLNNLPVMSNE